MTTRGADWGWKLCLVGFVAASGVIAGNDASAQIVPDATLGAESSSVTPNAGNVDAIAGGATRGANLFHSFEQFSVLSGREALPLTPSPPHPLSPSVNLKMAGIPEHSRT